MQHLKKFSVFFIFLLLFTSCNQDKPYKITASSVGPLTEKTKVSEIETLFENDSVVKGQSAISANSITIYEKGGKELLNFIPASKSDTATIKTIQVFDARYKTDAGISLNSTFKDLQEAYTINKVQSLLSTVIVFVDEINAYFTIDKKELPSELQFGSGAKVEPAQIPNGAKIKYFMIGW